MSCKLRDFCFNPVNYRKFTENKWDACPHKVRGAYRWMEYIGIHQSVVPKNLSQEDLVIQKHCKNKNAFQQDVYRSLHQPPAEVAPAQGVPARECVCPGGVCPGGVCPGGVCPMVCPGRLSAQGVSAWVGVCWQTPLSPSEQNDRHL